MPKVLDRIASVRNTRLKSKSLPTQALAQTPWLYHINVIPASPFLVIPEVNSERREYLPLGWMEPPVIPSNLVRVIENASLSIFALLSSAMHMSWLRYIGGRLASSYRYSVGLVYNTFPTPLKKEGLEQLAQAVLDAREKHPDSTLSQLYDPHTMPTNLRHAHEQLDRAVDRLYRTRAFKSDQERVEYLLVMYEKMISLPLIALAQNTKKRKGHSK
jgi:hypothetical protein